MIGASLACALSGLGLRLAVLEAQALSHQTHASYDDRAIALSQSSLRILHKLGLGPSLACTPIESIHISDQGQPGMARLQAHDEGVKALGAVTTARALGQCLMAALPGCSDVELLCPAQLLDYQPHADTVTVSIEQNGQTRCVQSRVLVAADGAQSPIRQQLGIATWQRDYGQTAIIANCTPELAHRNTAYERFTPNGPLALLPLDEQRCALVYTAARSEADAMLTASDEQFLARLQSSFGDRLGRFQRLGQRAAYPLRLVFAREHFRRRVVLVGNAAHTLHPIAGQGFNLGMRDIAVLSDVIASAVQTQQDIGSAAVLSRYADWRRWDQRRTVLFTDGLLRLFSGSWLPIRLVRNAGLLAFELLPPAKHVLARHAMGLAGPLPRLVQKH